MKDGVKEAVKNILTAIGEDSSRPGLLDTPKRVERFYADFFTEGEPRSEDVTVFPNGQDGVHYDQIILVRDIPVQSFCEHHMLPFIGKAHIAYLPHDNILGLSKFARIVRHFASRLQVQERLTTQVSDFLFRVLQPKGVMTIITAEHLCMSMRGVRAYGHTTTTSAIAGRIDKSEVLSLLSLR